jgi:hypothetical protein
LYGVTEEVKIVDLLRARLRRARGREVKAPLRGMLFDLQSLDVVRVIEDVDTGPTGADTVEGAEE